MKGEDAGGEGERLREEGCLPRQPRLLWTDGGSVSCLVLALQCRLKIAPLGGVSRERMGQIMSNTSRQRSLAGCEAGQEEKDLDTGKACQGCHQLTNGQLQVLHQVPPSICSVQDVFLNTCARACACVRVRTRNLCIYTSLHMCR